MSSLLGQVTGLHLAGVALGAGLGAVCRAAADRTVARHASSTRLPWATLAVNVVGSLILGLVLGWSGAVVAGTPEADLANRLELVVGVGFAGGLTTFSTFAWESWSLIREGRGRGMLAYAAATIGLGLMAVALGMAVGAAQGP